MKPLARKTAASTLTAALLFGTFPCAAFAKDPADADLDAAIRAAVAPHSGPSASGVAPRPGAPRPAPVSPAAALANMQAWGVYKGDDDVLKTYLGDGKTLTPLGSALYLSLVRTHDPAVEKTALLDEVVGLQPTLDRLRQNGPYDAKKQESVARTLTLFEKRFGAIGANDDGSVEGEYQQGALREALMTGAAVTDPPKQSDMVQVKVKDGYEFWDKKGLAYRINSGDANGQNAATTYNRELQKAQRAMNQSRPPEVPFVPETGRYNPEMFDYSYWRLKSQYDALAEGMRRDRVIALAELLGESGKYREDMWFTDKRIQADLEAEARAQVYSHHGQDYNVLELVDAKFKQRRYYLDHALEGVNRFKTDMDALKAGFKTNPVITDAQVQNLSLDEQGTLRFLSLGVLETQSFYTKNQIERLDPTSPDAEQVMKAIDSSDLTPEQKANYKLRAQEMVNRLQALNGVLEKTRGTLSASDYAASLDLANAALTSSQRELGLIGADYSMFVEIPSVASLAKQQGDVSWMNYGAKFTRWAYRTVRPGSDYTAAMAAMKANQPKYDEIARLIADGKTAEARQAVIAMNPDAVKGAFAAALGGDPGRITDAARLAASLKANRDRIGAVFETNKWLDTAGTFITWTIDMAIVAPVARTTFNGAGTMLARYTSESTPWLIRRAAILGSETLLHTAARLQSLDPDAVWVESQAGNAASRYLLATTMRAGSVAMRQASFTAMSGGISGAFTLGQHLWDVGSEKVLAPGESLTVDIATHTVLGFHFGGTSVGIRPSDSMFNSDFGGAMDAFWTGAKGGIWWANTPMEVGGVPVLMPGMLGYVGLPATVFRDTALMRYAELVGSRGVLGSGITASKWLAGPLLGKGFAGAGELLEGMAGETAAGEASTLSNFSQTLLRTGSRLQAIGAPAAEGAVQRGLLERLALAGEAGTLKRAAGAGTAFTLGMADNVAKYAVFSDVVGAAGNSFAYHFEYRDEPDLERRIKGANAAGQKWLASPAWMLIPTYAAHPARDAAIYQRGAQGAEQFMAADRGHEIANAEEGARLRFIKTPEIPLSQRIFEASLKAPETGDYFIVTKEMRREAIKNQMVSMLGGEKATPADIKPVDFYRATKMADGADFINLKVNDEVRLVAHQDFVESLLADPVRARSALDAPLGSNVDGFGRVTPEVQKDVAVALYSSEMQTGKPMPPELAGRVNEILKPYLEANRSVQPDAEGLMKALDGAPLKSEAFGEPSAKEAGWALKDVMTRVTEWKQTKSGSPEHPYTELITELRATADRAKADGKLTEPEHALLTRMYDYVESIEKRFNAFNNVDKAHGLAATTLGALRVQFEGNAGATRIVNDFSAALEEWAGAHGPSDFVDGPRSDGTFKTMMSKLAADLEKAKGGLTPAEFAALKGGLADVGASPWVLHDSKGSALPSWRPEQFESFMGTLTAIAQQGRGGAPVRLFQMLKTGGGKTMLTFEGLLPLVEADAAGRKMQPMFLTVQSNLEAQARMEFIAYKKIGSSLKFDTYEGFKTKIAEGKMKGKNALRDYWILGDEMDGAALQPALTIGQVSGGITKRSPVYNRIDELDTGLANRLTGSQSSRDTRAQTEARRAQNALTRLEGPQGETLIAEGSRVENAAGRLKDARGPEARRAALADIRDGVAKVEKLLDAVPSREADAVATARQALNQLKTSVGEPPADAAARDGAVRELETGFTRQENLLRLTGSEEGLTRVSLEAGVRGAELEGRIGKLTADIEAAKASKVPGSVERANALREELALAKKELGIVDRFRSEDAGQRLANLQEKIAGGTAEPGSTTPEAMAEWKKKAAAYEGALRPEARPTAKAHADALVRVYDIGREMRELDGQIADAAREGRPADDLKARRAALEGDYATVRSEIARLKDDLAAGSSSGDLGGMLRRLEVLRKDPSPAARSERAALLEKAQAEVRSRLSASADDVVALAREGKQGWPDGAVRLLERRREMMEAFGGGENRMYGDFRDMHDDMQAFALNEGLKSSDPAVYKPAAEKLMKLVNGQPLSRVPFKVAKMTWEVFTGRDVDVPIDQVGLTRLHAAKLLKSLLADPTMPAHQRDNLFWSLSTSLLWPGKTGSSSWVRTELLRQLHGFYEDSAGIRLDNRTGHINVVHNGQWFESMDNETRRFWELEYGVDLTLPYTNSSISTIKDITTDKKARFISFSGTAGEKLREHFEQNGIRIEGQGSTAPTDLGRVVVASLEGAPEGAREAIETRLGRKWEAGDVVTLADFNDPAMGAAHDWLSGLPRASSVRVEVISSPTEGFARIGESLANVNSSRGKVVVESLDGASPAAREAIEKKLGGPLTGSRVVKLSDFEGPNMSEARDFLEGLRERSGDADRVVLRKTDAVPAEAKPALEAYLKEAKLAGKDDAVVRISDVRGPDDASSSAAQAWLRSLRANQKETGLVVISVPDTRVLKMVRQYLMKVQGLKASEIAMVFSDTEYLRNNVPEAKVADQMNLGALDNGQARVLILDSRVGGRGLDLNFKGERSMDPNSFRGYTDFDMPGLKPQANSAAQGLQIAGRIDMGRVLPGASREFTNLVDMNEVQGDRAFRDMIMKDEFFIDLRNNDPKFLAFEKERGGSADWAMFDAYVSRRAAEHTPEGMQIAQRYEDAVKRGLAIAQGEIEENQLRSSSVLTDQHKTGGKFPGIEIMR